MDLLNSLKVEFLLAQVDFILDPCDKTKNAAISAGITYNNIKNKKEQRKLNLGEQNETI